VAPVANGPRVSVLLPVRDAETTIEACLDSIAAQTLGDHEIVVVDDGSRDGSSELLAARVRRDPRLVLLRTPPRGLVAALRLALAHARAPLVARMDADDVAHPERLARQVDRLERDPGIDVLGCAVAATGCAPGELAGEGMRRYVEWTNGLVDHEEMECQRFVESPLVHPSVVLRTAGLRGLGAWREFEGPEDYELWLRAFDAGLRFAKLPEVLLEWRDSSRRLTRCDPRYAPSRFLSVKLEALVRGPLVGRTAVVWGAGPIGKSWARALAGAGHTVQAFVEVNPRQIGRTIRGTPVLGLDAAPLGEGLLHLAAVGQPGARDRIRGEAARLGLREGRDFFAVA
jgi:glycosyltransferase involved in cell wall biosynthesis